MGTAEYEFIYLRAALNLLENYLLAKDLYRPINAKAPIGTVPYPQLTVGNLLMSLKRLQAYSLTNNQQAELTRIEQQLYSLQNRWRVAWEEKSSREFSARLKLWRDFLDEYRSSPENHADRYHYEISRRVLLELLRLQSGKLPPAEVEMLSGLDSLLFARFIPGDFIWETELINSFPPQPYWYLYGILKAG